DQPPIVSPWLPASVPLLVGLAVLVAGPRGRRFGVLALVGRARRPLLLALLEIDQILLGDDHRHRLVVAGELDSLALGRVTEHVGEALAGLGGRDSLGHVASCRDAFARR